MLSFLPKCRKRTPYITQVFLVYKYYYTTTCDTGFTIENVEMTNGTKVCIYRHYERRKYHDISLQLPKLTMTFKVDVLSTIETCNKVLFSVERLEKP